MTNYCIVSTILPLLTAISPTLAAILPILAAILGAIIGGWMTGKAMIKQTRENFNNDLEIIKHKEENEEKAVLKAIGVEIDVIIERYSSYIKPVIDKIAQYDSSVIFTDITNLNNDLNILFNFLSSRILVTQDYFTIYNSNGNQIGKIKDGGLQKRIVSFYTNIKGLIENIKLYNEYMESIKENLRNESEERAKIFQAGLKNDSAVQTYYKNYINRIIDLAKNFKLEQDRLLEEAKNVFR